MSDLPPKKTQFPVPDGWSAFGSHVDYVGPIEFSDEVGEDGLPFWERPVSLRQVWAVTYDSDTPMMDGSHPPIRMADQPFDWAQRNYDLMVTRTTRSPKRNLRIETRFVSAWEVFTPPE